jgi:holo-[acyl-carrier protein] synthase
MNVAAHGIDLVECARIASLVDRHGNRFCDRILTDRERTYIDTHKLPIPHIAGRFAAKEAILKVLGTGWRGKIAWRDIEILNDPAGRPDVTLRGECAAIAERLGMTRVLISITHTDTYASASAIGLSD